jgi:hypothetical protein
MLTSKTLHTLAFIRLLGTDLEPNYVNTSITIQKIPHFT